MSGTLTPAHREGDLTEPSAGPVPGFHRRKEVQLMLRRWRNSMSLWGRILSTAHDRRDSTGPMKLAHPQHIFHIR